MASTAATKSRAGGAASAEAYRGYLRQMLLIRRFEEKAGEMYSLGKIGGFCHLYIGQEAVAVGTIAALREDDYVISAYREHGQALARGMTPRSIMAELFGKVTGCSRGKGGSMHLFDAGCHFMGGHGIVGGQIPLAAGFGFAIKYRKQDRVVACYFGEAAVNIGSFHEALNMASLWKLPVVFIIENNGYGMGTALARASSILDLAHRSYSYEMANEVVDGQDVLTVKAAMELAVSRARTESKPTLLEIRTYRYVGHSMSDAAHGTYRTKEEVEQYRQRDPIVLLRDRMIEDGLMDQAGYDALEAEILVEVDDATTFAEESPDPEPSDLWTDVYAPGA
jgi:pyruvate dehydrogenase E1 component alpha subunit